MARLRGSPRNSEAPGRASQGNAGSQAPTKGPNHSQLTPIVPAAGDQFPHPPRLHATYVDGAYVSGRNGAIDFAHKNHRPVHGGVYCPGESNGGRATRQRIERQTRRAQRKAVRR